MKTLLRLAVFLLVLRLRGVEFQPEDPAKYWDFARLKAAPEFREAGFPESRAAGLQDILYQAIAPGGGRTEYFAYVGYPQGPMPPGGFPGIVLVHGGGGTAYPDAVRLWNSYGYAVIAIDWYHCRPLAANPAKRMELPGGKFRHQPNVEIAANIILAHSLLRSLPRVNPGKTGYVGLSWGSWFGAMVTAVDPRFRFAVEIYCGDLNPAKNALINGRFLHAAKVPLYWIVGTNDQNVTPLSSQKGFDACPTLWNKSMVIRLRHDHTGFRFPVCRRVADHFLMGKEPLPELGKSELDSNGILSAPIKGSGKGAKRAILCCTCEGEAKDDLLPGKTCHRKWLSFPAEISAGRISAKLPAGTRQCFLSLYDEESPWNDCCGSSDLLTLEKPQNRIVAKE